MSEEIHFISNEGKTARNEWENDDPTLTFFELYIVYIKKLGQIFSTLYSLDIVLLQVMNILKS